MDTQTHPTLLAQRRTESGKGSARRLRRAGQVPVACYGNDIDSLTLAVDLVAFKEAIEGPKGLNVVFNVEVEGEDLQFENVILHDYQVDPVSRALLHADLLVVDKNQPIEANVPIKSVGRARGERVGGRLRLMFPEIRVSCVASNIPDVITIDVSNMGPNDVMMASQLNYPEGVEPVFITDFAIARVMMPRQNVVGLDDVAEEEPTELGEAAEAETGAEADEGGEE